MKLNVAFQGIIIAVITVFILIYLQSLIMPLIFAVVVWLLIRGVKNHLRKIPVVGKRIPVWIQNVIAFTTIIGALVGVGMVLAENINRMIELGPKYTANIQGVLEMANEFFGINILSEAEDYIQNIKIANIATSVFDSLSSFISDIFLVVLYVIFLMAEESTIPRKLKYSASSDEKYSKTKEMIAEINESVIHYISLKTVLSLITGVASYIALLFIGVDLPMFWAILIFLLNYIPNIGSLIATAFPALMALLQFAEFTPFLLVILIVGSNTSFSWKCIRAQMDG